jgi:ankyrin repeat protein
MTTSALHRLVKKGDLQRVLEVLHASRSCKEINVNAYDRNGLTPLMHAVNNPSADVELVRALIDHGADIHQESREYFTHRNVVALALAGGDPQKIMILLEHGANIHYKRSEGYDALLDAVHGRDVLRDARLIDLLKLLIANGVELNSITSYQESGLRVLSRLGRFDAVRVLLDAGADANHLEWTPLIRAVALGSFADVKKEIESGASLEDKDWWERTAWLVAIQTGDIPKARFLCECGADTNARGRCRKPPLFYAIENYHTPMLRWLLETGISIEQTDEFGTTPLMNAAECSNLQAVEELLKAGADVNSKECGQTWSIDINGVADYLEKLLNSGADLNQIDATEGSNFQGTDTLLKAGDVNAEKNGQTALSFARTREVAMRLLEAGADPSYLDFEGRRAVLGLDPEPDEDLLDVSSSEYRHGRSRRFGTRNPEEMSDLFCEGMIRAGINAYQAAQLFKGQVDATDSPIWCAQRFGQSITLLPDGRIIQIAGEHEDSYDPDFCIYNDVFVHEPDGRIHIFGYPESIFPPTDFHTATLIDEYIYIIGSLGYHGTRQYGKTPVYRLDTKTFRIEPVIAGGTAPGWIYGHRAIPVAPDEICILGGKIVTWDGHGELHKNNDKSFVLDIKRLVWRVD